MPFQSTTTECFRLNEFSGLLQLAFGLNLALPILREFSILPRLPITRQLTAIEQLTGFRKYANGSVTAGLRNRIEAAKRQLIIIDESLKTWIHACATGTFLFALSALYFSFYAALDTTCLGRGLSLGVTVIHFVPLPAGILILFIRTRTVYGELSTAVAKLKEDAIGK
ncbi:hypothetical protein [Mesorhizobium sp.]|uniref:hypothetical protein n=1 Tax=Mesorhizobium sp. TaxID=1871066 RepID=UPI000FE53BD0|nr:hypothetical protein [Mesorhizobium sp.]RWD79739.1 MAG: hypothetical protein EOS48_21200 [Mesorhizobium sp.]